jgi:hypothetical protein
MCRLCWSQQKSLLLTSFQRAEGENVLSRGREGNEEENFLIILDFFTFFPSSSFFFVEYFSLFPYDDDMENCVVGCGCFFGRIFHSPYNFCVIFTLREKRKSSEWVKSGNGILGN